MALPRYIISKTADPIFGVLIGIGAAATRIRREECLEKGRSGKEVLGMLERRFALVSPFGGQKS
ncbi:hypothetical protein EV426DRAFT_438877 [Tirmania nivea]|nr:hypothetical protein EV426DRAFT_438877 [Tirmania nivea]